MKQLAFSSLLCLSPIDGRYHQKVKELSNYYSEYAYLKYRVLVEVRYLLTLSEIKIIRKFNREEVNILNNLANDFSINDAEKIKKIEAEIKHDVKAIEYFIKQKLIKTSLFNTLEFVHFGLTSEDINNIAIRLMLKDSYENIISNELHRLNIEILSQAKNYKSIVMLARTHGQSAVPTTLGKELLVFHNRIKNELKILEKHKFRGKINGAIGNYNALHFAYPEINWKKTSKDFLNKFNLDASLITTQIAPYEDIIYFFQTIQRINGIVLDFNQDMWRYISDGYFTQINYKNEIGSSTMPQKINPINFENSEGNITIANSLIDGFTNKLPVSRLQRDLSGSTITRNFGVVLAHSLLAYKNTSNGLSRIKANKEKIRKDLNSDYSVLTEAVQIYLKKEGIKNGYELTKVLIRGKSIDRKEFIKFIEILPLSLRKKEHLKALHPEAYKGK